MDYAPNGTLRQRHPAGAILPPQSIVPYINQVAAALQYAHDEKIIHRDVKPQNMLLDAHNEVLLSDFGIATVAHSMRSLNTNEQDVTGTTVYMAPEQFRGKACPASDQYALGVVAYEWLCGRPPFEGNFYALAHQHLNNVPQLLHEHIPTIPPAVEQVVPQALAKKPEERHPNVIAFAEALEQAVHFSHQSIQVLPTAQPQSRPAHQQPGLSTELSAQRPQTVVQQPSPPQQFRGEGATQALEELSLNSIQTDEGRNFKLQSSSLTQNPTTQSNLPTLEKTVGKGTLSRRTVLTVAAGVILAGGAGVVTLITHQQSSQTSLPPHQIGISQTTRGTRTPIGTSKNQPAGTTPTSRGPSHNQPSGTTPTSGGPSQNQTYTYHGHSDVIEAVAWSPNGQRVASGSDDKTVQVWNASDGGNVLIYRGHADVVWAVAWSPDGQRIASGSGYTNNDNTAQVWNSSNGSHIYTYTGHTGAVRGVAWSRDGQRIASGSYDWTVQVWNASDGGNVFTYKGHTSVVRAVAWSPDGLRIASCSVDKTVQVWNASNGSHLFTYTGHSGEVHSVAWSPDGQRIASGSDDKTVQVWNASNGSNAFAHIGQPYWVRAVEWSPNGQHIASGYYDGTSGTGNGTVQVWPVI